MKALISDELAYNGVIIGIAFDYWNKSLGAILFAREMYLPISRLPTCPPAQLTTHCPHVITQIATIRPAGHVTLTEGIISIGPPKFPDLDPGLDG